MSSTSAATDDQSKRATGAKSRSTSKTVSRSSAKSKKPAADADSGAKTLQGDAVLKPRATTKLPKKVSRASKERKDEVTAAVRQSKPSKSKEGADKDTPAPDNKSETETETESQPMSVSVPEPKYLTACSDSELQQLTIGQRLVARIAKYGKNGKTHANVRTALNTDLFTERDSDGVRWSDGSLCLDSINNVGVRLTDKRKYWTVVRNTIQTPYRFFNDIPFVNVTTKHAVPEVQSAGIDHVVEFLRMKNSKPPGASSSDSVNTKLARCLDPALMWRLEKDHTRMHGIDEMGNTSLDIGHLTVSGNVYIESVDNMALADNVDASHPNVDTLRFVPFECSLKFLLHQSATDISSHNMFKPSPVACVETVSFSTCSDNDADMQATVPCLAREQLFQCQFYDSETQVQLLVCYVYALSQQMAMVICKTALAAEKSIRLGSQCDVLVLPVDNTDCDEGFLFALKSVQPLLTESAEKRRWWSNAFNVDECMEKRKERNANTCYTFAVADRANVAVWFHGVVVGST